MLFALRRRASATSVAACASSSRATPAPAAAAARALAPAARPGAPRRGAAGSPAPAPAAPGAGAPYALTPLARPSKDGPLFEYAAPTRNVAVIAHVDHGKTSLVDQLLKTCAVFQAGSMDSNPLERERGITILSKVTGVSYRGTDIAIIDSPGHADFAGQVEQVLSMADGCLLVVCATEGPMVQTRFVLSKAIARGLKPIVVVNKADRDTARLGAVENAVFDLFVALEATDEQLDFPILYTSARHGWATPSLDEARALAAAPPAPGAGPGMAPLLDAMLAHVPPPRVLGGPGEPFRMLVSQMEIVPFVGKTLIGRVAAGTVRVGDALVALSREGAPQEAAKVSKLFRRRGMESVPVPSAAAGEIVELAGFAVPTPTSTLAAAPPAAGGGGGGGGVGAGSAAAAAAAAGTLRPLYAEPLDPPTISMAFSVNDSPLAAKGPQPGTQLTSSVIAARLHREAAANIALEVVAGGSGGGGGGGEALEVRGRGELQLAVLIETMRREGFELSVSPPTVLFRTSPGGERQEPYESVIVDVDEAFSGVVIEKLALRKATMTNFGAAPGGKARIEFTGPSRGLIGVQSELKSETRGTAVLNRRFSEYGAYVPGLERKPRGVLVSTSAGATTGFALAALEARGVLFVTPGEETYSGAIVGENSKEPRDMEVNPVKAKKLTNIRSAGAEELVRLSPPRLFSLEEAIVYVAPDELVEVTPTAIRMRKRLLDASERERAARSYSKSIK